MSKVVIGNIDVVSIDNLISVGKAIGATGAIGIIGFTGSQGSSGLVGLTGPQGLQGLQGIVGPTGASQRGATGSIGASGPPGDYFFARRSSNNTVLGQPNPVLDTQLQIAINSTKAIGINRTWFFRAELQFDVTADESMNIQLNLSASANEVSRRYVVIQNEAPTVGSTGTQSLSCRPFSTLNSKLQVTFTGTNVGHTLLFLYGYFVCTGNGTFSISYNNDAGGGSVTAYPHSIIMIEEGP